MAASPVGILCFREFFNAQLAGLEGEGLTIYDLESDVKAFTIPLPRVCIIPLEDFDPLAFL